MLIDSRRIAAANAGSLIKIRETTHAISSSGAVRKAQGQRSSVSATHCPIKGCAVLDLSSSIADEPKAAGVCDIAKRSIAASQAELRTSNEG